VTKADARSSGAQFPSGWLVIALLVVTAVLWGFLAFVAAPHLKSITGGAPPLDLRWQGYDVDDVSKLMEALGPEGRAYYLVPALALDMFFPLFYAASHALALWWLTMPNRSFPGAMPIALRRILIVPPIAEFVFDWTENICGAIMIWSWPDISPALVRLSSLATQIKFVAAPLTEILLIVFALMALLRWGRRQWQ
jgi:hypothetical protein